MSLWTGTILSCSSCDTEVKAPHIHGRTRERAVAMWIEQGWRNVGAYSWLCPTCAQVVEITMEISHAQPQR